MTDFMQPYGGGEAGPRQPQARRRALGAPSSELSRKRVGGLEVIGDWALASGG
jgi:hypothetical protein